MTWDHRRTEWQTAEEPVTGPLFVWRKLQRIVLHYNGGRLRWPYDTAQVLRNQQHMYLSKPTPYSLGYNDAVDGAGETWEIRGEDIKCAANVEVNDSSYAIQILVWSPTAEEADPANDAQIEGVRRRVARIREVAGWKVPIVGHFAVATQSTHSPCPGLAIRDQLAAGVFEPIEHEQPSQPDPIDPDPTPEPEDNMAKRTLYIPTDCDAQFIGWGDEDGNALEVWWVDKERADAHRSVGVVIRDQLTLGGFRNCVLLGPLPQGDTRHDWDGSEFFRVVT